ncbi:MAG: hypothetical protein C6H99_05890 [Epsilonproteobacteria bacterium]|nr:hypothetical protein [Campylobacterota bacterium]NPA63967.1 hypothetical protein [Campylobacterota bacterium]
MELHIERTSIFKYRFYRKRFVFNDAYGNYYFIQLEPSEFGFDVEVIGFDAKMQPMRNDKVASLAKFLKGCELEFFRSLAGLAFDVKIVGGLSERFVRHFLREKDREFIFCDPGAKHWIIDFAAIAKGEWQVVQPKLFPWHIKEVDVAVMEDGRLVRDGEPIGEERFWELYERYLHVKDITLGDFSAVLRGARLAPIEEARDFLLRLVKEVQVKTKEAIVGF